MKHFLSRVRLSVSVSALITLALGLLLTALLFASVRRVESEARKAQFAHDGQARIAAVAGGLAGAVEQVVVLNQLFRTVGAVSREQFHTFTKPLLARYPEIQALSYQRLLLHPQRAGFEAAMRRRYPDFAITEFVDGKKRTAAERDSYNVVEYIEPASGNESAFGLDTGADPRQADVRRRARRDGIVVATGLLSLVQHRGRSSGFLVLAPVYMKGAPLDTPALRERAVVGETAAVFRVGHLIHTLLGAGGFLNTPGMAIHIYASDSADEDELAFRNGQAGGAVFDAALLPRWLLYDRADPIAARFTVAGKPWHMVVDKSPVAFYANHSASLYALGGGILLSLLAAAYVYSLVTRAAVIARVTGERTAELHFANQRLSQDLAQTMRTEQALRLREKIIEVSSNAIIICSAQGPEYAIEYVNPAFEAITGYSAADVIGRSFGSLEGASHDQHNIDEIHAALREQREGHALLRNFRKDGSGYWNELYITPMRDDNGGLSHFVVTQYDVTAVMGYEAELEFQASHDALTGLANRNLLQQRLTQAIGQACTAQTHLWVVFVDLDRFKFVNDTLGHEAGDLVLKELALLLRQAVRPGDTVARMGGDEFVLVLPEQGGDGGAMQVIHNVMEAVAKPLLVQAHEFFLTCSVGIAVFPGDGDTADTLTKHADIAMYRAKELGRNTFQFYVPAMNQRTLERLQIEADLRHALDRNEFVLHYQPKMDLGGTRVMGMEALLRWKHPVLGMIAPSRFIGLAEEMGLIIPIGAWVIRTACAQTKAWQGSHHSQLKVAINLSPRQFTQKALVESIARVLDETGLEAGYLELELTESMVMNDVESAITILRNLKGLGATIAIDDFGTGYSSLSYLRRFPIDVLKIDQSFVRDLVANADDAAIVVSIISLAHSLRLTVVAEGVETAEQLAFLRKHGCDQMQGYYFSRPVDAAAFGALLLEAGKPLHHRRLAGVT